MSSQVRALRMSVNEDRLTISFLFTQNTFKHLIYARVMLSPAPFFLVLFDLCLVELLKGLQVFWERGWHWILNTVMESQQISTRVITRILSITLPVCQSHSLPNGNRMIYLRGVLSFELGLLKEVFVGIWYSLNLSGNSVSLYLISGFFKASILCGKAWFPQPTCPTPPLGFWGY